MHSQKYYGRFGYSLKSEDMLLHGTDNNHVMIDFRFDSQLLSLPSSARQENHYLTVAHIRYQLIMLNYPVTLSHRRSNTVSLKTYPLHRCYIPQLLLFQMTQVPQSLQIYIVRNYVSTF